MATLTDADGNEIDIDDLSDSAVIRCKNWEDDPEFCGQSCGVPVPKVALRSAAWIEAILDYAPEWFVMYRSCSDPAHRRHFDPYCCVGCFERYHGRHDHPHHPDDGHDHP